MGAISDDDVAGIRNIFTISNEFPLYYRKSSVAIKVKEDGADGANYALGDAVDIRGSVPNNPIRLLSSAAGWHLLHVPDCDYPTLFLHPAP